MELNEFYLEALQRLKDGDESATKAVCSLAYDLISEAVLALYEKEDVSRGTRFKLLEATISLLDELQWRQDYEDDGKDFVMKCEKQVAMLCRFDEEAKKRR